MKYINNKNQLNYYFNKSNPYTNYLSSTFNFCSNDLKLIVLYFEKRFNQIYFDNTYLSLKKYIINKNYYIDILYKDKVLKSCIFSDINNLKTNKYFIFNSNEFYEIEKQFQKIIKILEFYV